MVRCLDAQARAIWPFEKDLLASLPLSSDTDFLDLGCGTGEMTSRLLELWPKARATGVDLIKEHLNHAQHAHPELANRWQLKEGDAMDLSIEDDRFDLAICRHLLQAVPSASQVLDQLIRVTRSGGWLHLLAEDYGMIHFSCKDPDIDTFWREGPWRFAEKTGTDLRSGRKIVTHLQRRGLQNIKVQYISIDNINTDKSTMAAIFQSWKDGYSEAIVEHSAFTLDECHAYFDAMLDSINNGYAVWHVPIIQAQVN